MTCYKIMAVKTYTTNNDRMSDNNINGNENSPVNQKGCKQKNIPVMDISTKVVLDKNFEKLLTRIFSRETLFQRGSFWHNLGITDNSTRFMPDYISCT